MADIKLQTSDLLSLLSIQRTFPRADSYDSYMIKGIAGPDKDGSVYAVVHYYQKKDTLEYDYSDVADRILKLDMKNRRIQWVHKVTGSLIIDGGNGRN